MFLLEMLSVVYKIKQKFYSNTFHWFSFETLYCLRLCSTMHCTQLVQCDEQTRSISAMNNLTENWIEMQKYV